MSEQDKTASEVENSVSTKEEDRSNAGEVNSASGEKKVNVFVKYVIPVIAVVIIILSVLYILEKEGRSSTNLFGEILASQEANAVVAVVNGKEIINSQLTTSIQQFSQVAAAQGIDIEDEQAKVEIKDQALEVLVNTELLKQAAEERGLSVSDEEVAGRLTEIEAEIGGAETLATRMEALGISGDQLRNDVHDELLIQQLLDQVFAETDTEVTDEEISQVYEVAGGEEAGLPELAEVEDQVRAQIIASKEQEAIDVYLESLRESAEIEVK